MVTTLVLLVTLASTSCAVQAKSPEKVVGDMAMQFLEDFSRSDVPTAVVMRNFLPGDPGTVSEWHDVAAQRATRRMVHYRLLPPRVVVGPPNGACEYRGVPADACVYVEVEWTDMVVGPPGDPLIGRTGKAVGMDQVGAKFVKGRWWLTSSDWRPDWKRSVDPADAR